MPWFAQALNTDGIELFQNKRSFHLPLLREERKAREMNTRGRYCVSLTKTENENNSSLARSLVVNCFHLKAETKVDCFLLKAENRLLLMRFISNDS